MQREYPAIRILLKQGLLVVLCSHYLSVSARPDADDLVARVNGETISRSFYDRCRGYLEKNLSRKFTGSKLKQELAKQERDVLNTLFDELLLRQRAEELGISPQAEVVKHLDQMRRDNGLDNFESLERFFVAKGIDPREFKHDLEQQLLKDRLLHTDADLQQKEKVSPNFFHNYLQKLRRSSIIEVKHGFIDTGVAYTEDLNQDLLIAARVGDTPKIRILLTNGANPNAVAPNGYCGLMHAADMGHKETVEALLAGGAQPNAKNHSGDTALLLAAVEGYKDIVTVLLANKAAVDVQDGDGVTPLIHASTNCKTEIVSSLLERKIDVNSGDKSGRTALIAATAEGCSGVVTALLNREADPNLMDSDGRTALIYAVESGRKDLIQALLQKGARVNARDNEGKTALIYAVIVGRLDLLQQLLVEPVDVNSTDNESQTPLMYAAAGGSEQMVQVLLDTGADTKALTWSLQLIRYNSVGIPIEPAEADQPGSSSGLTALDIAKRNGHSAVVELLKKAETKRE